MLFELGLGLFRDRLGICLRSVWNLFGFGVEPAWGPVQIGMIEFGAVWNRFEIEVVLGSVWDRLQINLRRYSCH